jgi:hypothetical protein
VLPRLARSPVDWIKLTPSTVCFEFFRPDSVHRRQGE